MINDNVYSVELMSANKKHLDLSLICLTIAIAMQSVLLIKNLFATDIKLAFLVEFLVLIFIFLSIAVFRKYKRRTRFTLYYAKNNDVDLEKIATELYIVYHNKEFVVFVERKKRWLYYDWFMRNEIHGMYEDLLDWKTF